MQENTMQETNQKVNQESKEQRFVRIAEPRITRACKAISLLGNLASSGYSYTDAQVDAMFTAVQKSLDDARAAFRKREKAGDFHFE